MQPDLLSPPSVREFVNALSALYQILNSWLGWIVLGGMGLLVWRYRGRPAARQSIIETQEIVRTDQKSNQSAARSDRTVKPQQPVIDLRASNPNLKAEGDRAWIPADQSVRFGHAVIAGPVYVGRRLAPANGFGARDNCLLDPSLPIGARPDDRGQSMDYWPSYETMSPAARRALIDWLSTDRSDPTTYIGYVFVYFYGLERRAILEQSDADRPALRSEVKRLLAVYGYNRSFNRYATELLSAIDLLDAGTTYEPALTFEPAGGQLPASVRVAIGYRLKNGLPIEPERLLSWTMSHPDTRVKTPARRAFPELSKLFASEFCSLYPNGVSFDCQGVPSGPVLYRSASGTFVTDLTDRHGGLPDAARHERALTIGRAILEKCTEQLEAYSRVIGKRPELAGSLQAIALLPPNQRTAALQNLKSPSLTELRKRASRLDSVPIKEVFRAVTTDVPEKYTSARLRDLADVLAKFGIGITPDPRFAITSSVPEKLVLFTLGTPTEHVTASEEYRTILLTVSLGILVARVDGEVGDEERLFLVQQTKERATLLSADEQRRLVADLRWMQSNPVELKTLRSKLNAASVEDRKTMAEWLIGVATVGGVGDRAEIALLERIYRQLNLDPELLYSGLHRELNVPVPANDDIELKKKTGFAIPLPPDGTATTLDKTRYKGSTKLTEDDRLAKIRAESAAVTSILDKVLETEGPEVPVSADFHKLEGSDALEPRYARLLQDLLQRGTWPMTEFERLVREHGLLPGAVVENLNNWSHEQFDDVLIEYGDPIIIHRQLVTALYSEAAE